LSSSNSDDRATLAELVKGKTGGVGSFAREGSPGYAEDNCAEEEGQQRSQVTSRVVFVPFSVLLSDVLPFVCSPGPAPKQRRVVEEEAPTAATPDMAESSRRAGGVGL